MPEQTAALARIPWPLVLTTNYDELFARAYAEADRSNAAISARRRVFSRDVLTHHEEQLLAVLGRSEGDVQRVLSSLAVTDAPILWALQGCLPTTTAGVDAPLGLESEIVVGHEEYRRVTHRQQHFRRAFAEVFRRRSFLFLGSGLQESYFLDLFNEVLEFFGPNPHPHFALACDEDHLDDEFLRTRFNILVVRYEGKFDALPKMLGTLAGHLRDPGTRASRWGYRFEVAFARRSDSGRPEQCDDLTIVSGGLPPVRDDGGECAVLSASLSGANGEKALLSDWARAYAPDFENDARVTRRDAGASFFELPTRTSGVSHASQRRVPGSIRTGAIFDLSEPR